MNHLDASLILIAAPRTFWHGTTDLNLQTILSRGLDPDETDRTVWGKKPEPQRQPDQSDADYRYDFGNYIQTEQKRSYGGSYFSLNWMTAYSSAGKAKRDFGGNRLIVAAVIEPRSSSVLLDEDVVPDPVSAISAAFGVAVNDYWLANWVVNGYRGLGKAADELLRIFSYNHPPADPRRIQSGRDKAAVMIRAWVERDLSAAFASRRTSYNTPYTLPDIKTWDWRQKEEAYRVAVTDFSKTMGWAANVPDGAFSHNVRVTEPVGFAGANRVAMIFRCYEQQDPKYGIVGRTGAYYETFEVVWGSDPGIAKECADAASTSVSENIIIYGADRVYYTGKQRYSPAADEAADETALSAALSFL